MIKKVILLSMLSFSSVFCEVSAFGDSGDPYGLSESEKIIFQNKKKIRNQNQRIMELSEQIEGMRSVIDSLSSKIGSTGQRLSEINEKSSSISESDISSLKSELNNLKDEQNQKFEKVENVLKKLSSMIDKINGSYVSVDALAKKKLNTKKISSEDEETTSSKRKKSNLSNSELLKSAVSLYRKEYYTKAYPMFVELAEKSYKPATSNYYLGEISYYKKRYKDAIVYYKKSVGYYDKASYMPTLLLHTGICFDKLDDSSNKEKFLNALLDSYPNSSEAEIAQKYLN